MKAKLSPYQQRIVEHMRETLNPIVTVCGLNAYVYLTGFKGLRWDTVTILSRKGVIRTVEEDWRHVEYGLADEYL